MWLEASSQKFYLRKFVFILQNHKIFNPRKLRLYSSQTFLMEELFNLPPLVLKARHLSGSAFCLIDIGLPEPEQAVGGFPPGLGLVVEDRPSELSWTLSECHQSLVC